MGSSLNRRKLIQASFFLGAAGPAGFALAQEACLGTPSPSQPEGPFYPVKPQRDLDADLTRLAGKNQVARGEILDLWVQVQDEDCQSLEGALVDLWQACATGKYNHPRDPNTADLDPYFQYWAKAYTDASGYVKIRTIKPGAYPAADGWIRPPHIHFKISAPGFRELTTQMYFAGEALNQKDLILLDLPLEEGNRLIVRFDREEGEVIPKGVFTVQLKKT
ncbi:dioxygenase family protein [Oligoflexus tunisiensis]|uniref:dioxygenase family protein n=1 Tax=Oligoflexus tunisiensis TaxID=708132 RepID=UPI00114CD3D0|nr:protocatechuate 3,4-dioxygenase [Oligoflexus tunisiensis]